MRTEAQLRPVAGFQVATTGRFWVAAGGNGKRRLRTNTLNVENTLQAADPS